MLFQEERWWFWWLGTGPGGRLATCKLGQEQAGRGRGFKPGAAGDPVSGGFLFLQGGQTKFVLNIGGQGPSKSLSEGGFIALEGSENRNFWFGPNSVYMEPDPGAVLKGTVDPSQSQLIAQSVTK